MTEEWVFRAQNLTVGYGRRALFRDLSLVVGKGEILGIVGPNGSGKTTIVRTLLGLVPPLAGSVERRPPDLRVSYAPQRERIDQIAPLSALDIVLMERSARAGPLHRIGDADRAMALQALTFLGVEELAGRMFRSLSGGEQQRVRQARALAADPDVLVLDEPTTGMDLEGEVATTDFLRDLNRRRGVTILIVTHELALVLNLATSILLVRGQGILHGPVDEVLQAERLTELYGVPVQVGRLGGQRTLVAGRAGGSDV